MRPRSTPTPKNSEVSIAAASGKPQRRSLRSRVRDTALLRWLRQRSWAKEALKQYGLGDARFTLVKEGINQRKLLFRVESPSRGRFLLRVYKLTRPNENLMPELLWLQALGREMPVPEPIPAADGSLSSLLSPR